MKRITVTFCILCIFYLAAAQQVDRPKLVVGVVIDQMRWDYLYRYYDRYAENGGFKRMLKNGFSCENTLIPYTPTVTACGHASIYTGSVPAINGITGNAWRDRLINRTVYCVEDNSVQSVGSTTSAGKMSPANLFTTTITDELKLATNFKSKIIGVALKDRGSILPAGHAADGAYWFDASNGNWITSSYYAKNLPQWVTEFNDRKMADHYFAQGWNTMLPLKTYTQSTEDERSYENALFGKGFPYNLKNFIGKNYAVFPVLPQGNTFTIDFAKAAIEAEKMGDDNITDFITISFSSPDYIGHNFGPNSIEEEDNYLRLDKDLGDMMDYLDEQVGKNNYLMFLSADHGVAHVSQFLKDHKIPSGGFRHTVIDTLKQQVREKFGMDGLIEDYHNYQLFLNPNLLSLSSVKKKEVTDFIIHSLIRHPAIARAFSLEDVAQTTLPEKIKSMVSNGYYPNRSGDIQIVLHPHWMEAYSNTGTTHGSWNPYDAHIPLLWYGWGVKHGKTNREVYMTDIAPTLAALLKIQEPSGSVGKVIEEVFK